VLSGTEGDEKKWEHDDTEKRWRSWKRALDWALHGDMILHNIDASTQYLVAREVGKVKIFNTEDTWVHRGKPVARRNSSAGDLG
jgi:hypothetical protein